MITIRVLEVVAHIIIFTRVAPREVPLAIVNAHVLVQEEVEQDAQ